MNTLQFTAYGLPKAQPRVKAVRRGNHAGVYDPGTANEWKRIVKEAARKEWNGTPFDKTLMADIEFWMPRPKSHCNKNGLKNGAPQYHGSKPDLDNLLKAVFDALTDLGVWVDDSLICRVVSYKGYCRFGQEPYAVIRIEEWE